MAPRGKFNKSSTGRDDVANSLNGQLQYSYAIANKERKNQRKRTKYITAEEKSE